ncbi:SCO4848 family membrane protein [Planctomonas psychrotolerans]|uniref:SCO4848 family membrane protein n=1 Tax=Planctomonas psychrotolerans TaxID=2528712 RepID=UPI00123BCF32|nr:hypothetical protein [Planctomonas psychrotolerans]
MIPTLAVLLLVNAAWNFIVWPAFLRRVSKDARARTATGAPTRFLQVHRVLVGISLALATALLVFGILLLTTGIAA